MKLLTCETIRLRSRFETILQDKVFTSCDYLKIVTFLSRFPSRSEQDKVAFLETLVPRLRSLPSLLIASRLIPLLLTSRFLMLHPGARNCLLPYLFIPTKNQRIDKPLVSEALFRVHVIPVLVGLYHVNKIQVRVLLLEYLEYYASYISLSTWTDELLPQIMLGAKDEDDQLVALTHKAIYTTKDKEERKPGKLDLELDISSLDIKVSQKVDEVDLLFSAMEPKLQFNKAILSLETNTKENDDEKNSKFAIQSQAGASDVEWNEAGWDEDF